MRHIQRSRLGLARSFQITSLFLDLSVLDNVALAVQAHAGHSFHFWQNARKEEVLRAPARAALERAGLSGRADWPAAALSHGEHRQLELAMALAGNPRMLLLDEPMAGLGPEESARMVAMLRALKQRTDDPSGRARHGGGVRAGRPYYGVGLWPRYCLRYARRRFAANAQVREAYLGETDKESAHV